MFSTLSPLPCAMPTASPLIGSSGISPLRKTMKSARIAPKKFQSLASLTCTAPHVDGSKYTKELLIKSIVTPDLYNVELQNSYGVKRPDDLLMAMVDDPGEYNALVAFVQNLQGFNTSFNDLVDEAKN